MYACIYHTPVFPSIAVDSNMSKDKLPANFAEEFCNLLSKTLGKPPEVSTGFLKGKIANLSAHLTPVFLHDGLLCSRFVITEYNGIQHAVLNSD